MRYRIAFAMVSVSLLLFILAPSSTLGQFKGKKGGGGPGGFGGGFGPKGGGDPNTTFDFLAKSRPYFLVTDSPRLSAALSQFLQERGITSGQVTRDLFIAFNAQMSAGQFQGGFGPPGGFGGGGFGGGGFGPGGFGAPANPMDTINRLAESDFTLRDRNGDGFLNMDEMPSDLKSELFKWDTNRDNLISLDEYKVYYATRMQNRRGGGNQQINPVTIIIEDEVDLDSRPVVYGKGKLPTGLPDWFEKLANRDGQVALYSWRKAGKDIDDFLEWDRNDDGFITVEEALYKQKQMVVASSKSEDGESPGLSMRPGNGFGKKGGFGGDDGFKKGKGGGNKGRNKDGKGGGFQQAQRGE